MGAPDLLREGWVDAQVQEEENQPVQGPAIH
jgi:hypothetical protein